jgi:hypothetical protein
VGYWFARHHIPVVTRRSLDHFVGCREQITVAQDISKVVRATLEKY